MVLNPNCSGSHCRSKDGEVRVYPLGKGANNIYCFDCWAHENKTRFQRGRDTGNPEDFPQHNWFDAEVYTGQ